MNITDAQKIKIREIAQKYHLKLVLLFGSQSIGRTTNESDIDLAYVPEKSLNFSQEYHLNFDFTNVFQENRVDTVDIRKSNPLLMYAVFQHPQILFQNNDKTFAQYRAYSFKKYVEAKPFYEEKARRLKENISMIHP